MASFEIEVKHLAVASIRSNAEAQDTQHPDVVLQNGSSQYPKAANVKKNGVNGSPEENQTLLSMAPSSCDVVGGCKNCNGRATQQKSKNGEALQVSSSLSNVSPFFALRLTDAAKELGISMTSLKNGCRRFGLPRWPGRKVRALESTIDGLQRSMGGQGADLGSVEEATMRSEIPKLQQELHELYHGTPEQITEKMSSPAVITKSARKRLYKLNGRRSKNHNPGRHDINAGDQFPNLTSGLAPASARDSSTGADPAAKSKKQPERQQKLVPCTDDDPPANQPTPNADQESARKSIRPISLRRILRLRSRQRSRDSEMKASDLEGLLPEVHDVLNVEESEVPQSIVQEQNDNNTTLLEGLLKRKLQGSSITLETEIGEAGTGYKKVAVEEKGATDAGRSGKRPKLQIRGGKCRNNSH